METWLYAELGRAVRTAADPAVAVFLDVHARHHAWHAELLGAQLALLPPVASDDEAGGSGRADSLGEAPDSSGDPSGDAGRPPGATGAAAAGGLLAPLSSLLAGLPDEQAALGSLAVAYRVLVPRLVSAYAELLEGTSPVADAPVQRAAELAQTDELRHWEAGERAVQSLLVSALVVGEAAALVGRAEAWLVAAGGLLAGPPLSAGGS